MPGSAPHRKDHSNQTDLLMNFTPASLAASAACALLAAPALTAAGPEENRQVETEEEQPEAEVENEAKEDKRICRRIRVDMSSRRKTRVCLTAEEWRELNQRR